MTLHDLWDQPLPPSPLPVEPIPQKTKTKVEQVAEYFKAHPNTWIDGFVFREFAGGYGGWSARIREAKKRFGMAIENRQRKRDDGSTVSEYRWVRE